MIAQTPHRFSKKCMPAQFFVLKNVTLDCMFVAHIIFLKLDLSSSVVSVFFTNIEMNIGIIHTEMVRNS